MNQEKEPQNNQPSADAEELKAAAQTETEEKAADGRAEEKQETAAEEMKNTESVKTETDESEKKKKRDKPPFYQSQNFKHGSAATAFTAVFIAAVVLVNVLVGILVDKYPSLNLDMTKTSANTLSAQAVKIVDKVKIPATIYICATKQQVESGSVSNAAGDYSQVGSLAGKIAERNSNIKVEYVDLDKNPTFTAEYKTDNVQIGDVIVKTDKRYRVLANTDLFETQYSQDYTSSNTYSNVDSALVSALNMVITDTLPVAAVDTGHSEKMDSTKYVNLLKNNSFETKDFNLLTDKIPDKTQLVVLGCPSTDLTDAEVTKLQDYLKNQKFNGDRSLMVTYSPGQSNLTKLSAFMEEWGLAVDSTKVAVETDQQKYLSGNPIYMMANVQTALSLGGTKTSYSNFISPYSCPVSIKFANNGTKQTYSLVKSNDTSYVYTDGQKTSETPATSAQDLAALSQDLVKVGDKSYKANVIAMGSTMMFSGDFIGTSAFSDGDYLVDLSRYSTGTNTESMKVTTTSHELYSKDIIVNSALGVFLGLGVFTVLIPLIIMIAGIVVYRRRRSL